MSVHTYKSKYIINLINKLINFIKANYFTSVQNLIIIIVLALISHAEAKTKNTFLSREQYSKLSQNQKNSYLNEIRTALVSLEKQLNRSNSFANNMNPPLQGYDLLHSWLLPYSNAQSAKKTGAWKGNECIAGGVKLKVINGFCSVKGNNCNSNGKTNGFQCGEIFGKTCISMDPIVSISERCEKESEGKILNEDIYKKSTQELEKNIQDVCASQVSTNASSSEGVLKPCSIFWNKIDITNKKYKLKELTKPSWIENKESSTDGKSAQKTETDDKKDDPAQCPPYDRTLSLGATHAMCLSCVYDHAIDQGDQSKRFRSSRAWITYLSLAQQLCKDQKRTLLELNDKTLIKEFSPLEIMTVLSEIGACSESTYSPLKSSTEADWAQKFADTTNEKTKKNWIGAFGISPDKTKELFCPSGEKSGIQADGYLDRLKTTVGQSNPDVDDNFKKCAQEIIGLSEQQKPQKSCPPNLFGLGRYSRDQLGTIFEKQYGNNPSAIILVKDGEDIQECITFDHIRTTGTKKTLDVVGSTSGLLSDRSDHRWVTSSFSYECKKQPTSSSNPSTSTKNDGVR